MKKNLILIATAAALLLTGCDGGGAQPSASPSPSPSAVQTAAPSPSPTPAAREEEKIELTQEDPFADGWTVVGETEYDVISDGNADIISLVTSAQQEDGVWLFDDSQEWGLVVRTEGGNYVLYDDHAHGMLYMDVSEFYEGDETVPVISLYIFSGAGTEIRQFRYRDGAFYQSTAYTTTAEADGGINRIYSTVPVYQ